MFLISNGVWILQFLSKKLDFWRKNFLKIFPAEDRTGDPWIMSSLTRPLDQNNLLEIRANINASRSAGNFCNKFRAAGISNILFKSLMSASNFMWKSRESKLFWFVFRMFPGVSGEFFFKYWTKFFFAFRFLPHLTGTDQYLDRWNFRINGKSAYVITNHNVCSGLQY